MRRATRISLAVLAIVVLIAVVTAVWGYGRLQASLPVLDGRVQVAGMTAPVTIERDALGIPTIRGRSRLDVARASGFLHAQDRFFQMDLNRRRAAGELSALVGSRALALDVEIRPHRFRPLAERALGQMAAPDRALLDAYAAGVNAGLAALDAPPFEYLLLGQDPQPWRAEDSLLVVLSMFITLQDTDGSYEATAATMRDVLPAEMFAFMLSPGTEWDAPLDGEGFAVPPIPGPDVYDLRTRRTGKRRIDLPPLPRRDRVERPQQGSRSGRPNRRSSPTALLAAWLGIGELDLMAFDRAPAVGSNNWAVSGTLTADGAPLLANDMHLSIRVPNIWYRAVLEWTDERGESHRLAGVTLPGTPALVAGSNGYVAWGFTNTYADWGDIVLLETDPTRPDRYLTPHGWREFEYFDEVIEIAGDEPRHERVAWTIWGPVLDDDHRGRRRAYKWVAHEADRLASAAAPFETARTIAEVFDTANGLGTPGQNIVAIDRDGRIGWSIYGAIPRRVGIDGLLPASWADGTRSWQGWLDTSEYPRIVDPPGGRIWTANARVVGGEMLARLGDGSYEVGSRATVIRDRLMAGKRFTPDDMLAIQLDDSAVFLERWRTLMLDALTPAMTDGHPSRAALREIVLRDWTGRASPDSAGYRLTRMFREQVSERVMAFLLVECYEADPAFDHTTLRRREGPTWKVLTERPMHLLDPQFASWDDLLAAAFDTVIERATRDGDLRDSWADYNVTLFRHPLSGGIPFGARLLDMRYEPLPGDLFTPRVHWGSIAASQRMVVSPGRESEGIMQMPTGQSGHPLSPFYANSHDAWVRGEPSPFLPGERIHTLMLEP